MSVPILSVSEMRLLPPPPAPVQAIRPVAATGEASATGEATKHETGNNKREPAAAAALSPDKSKEELSADLQRLQKSFDRQGITLKFSRDEETDQLVVKMIDQKTGEAVRQLPSEVSLKLTAEIGKLQGLIIDRKV